jgi:hypothetical protein
MLETLDLPPCLDETINDGGGGVFSLDYGLESYLVMMGYNIILETDSTTFAPRRSRPKADTTEIIINKQVNMRR